MIKINNSQGTFVGKNGDWELVPNTVSDSWLDEALTNEWIEFIDSIRSNRRTQVDGEYAQHIMEIINSAYKSSEQNREIQI